MKYDTTGSVVWAQKFGGTNDDRGSGVAVDAQHNCYVTGYFDSTNFIFGGVTLTNYAPNGNSSLFVAKLDATGNLLWARSPGQVPAPAAPASWWTALGTVMWPGSFSGTNYFGSTNLVSRGYSDALLLKYDPDGNLLWAQQAGGNYVDGASGLALDAAGNAYLLANIRSTNAGFGSYVFSVKGTNTCQNMVVAKYSPAGTVLWAKLYGGTDVDSATDIAIGPNTNCYLTGIIRSTISGLWQHDVECHGRNPVRRYFCGPSQQPAAMRWRLGRCRERARMPVRASPWISSGIVTLRVFSKGTNLVFNSGWLGAVTLTNSESGFSSDADAFVAEFDGYGNVMHTFQPTGGTGTTGVFPSRWMRRRLRMSPAGRWARMWVFGSFATTNAYLDMFVTKLDPNYPMLRIDDGDHSTLMPAPGRVWVCPGRSIKPVQMLPMWKCPPILLIGLIRPGYIASIYGGGRRWLEFDKPVGPVFLSSAIWQLAYMNKPPALTSLCFGKHVITNQKRHNKNGGHRRATSADDKIIPRLRHRLHCRITPRAGCHLCPPNAPAPRSSRPSSGR